MPVVGGDQSRAPKEKRGAIIGPSFSKWPNVCVNAMITQFIMFTEGTVSLITPYSRSCKL